MKKPVLFGKYYLLERINIGGMAEVFRAKAFGVEGFERLVAVKRILPNIAEDKEFIKMFVDEAKIAVQLNHANIAQIFDLGVVDTAYYIALEHIHGRDVRAVFDRSRAAGEPMPIAQACFVTMKVCEGLDYAHNKRDQAGRELHLVHRDVSPQNILVSFEGEVKLIDFGIAKAADKQSKTQAGILKGKFGYMSPEQVRGIPIDRRSDVFSCGIVLYELLTGERLFVGESDFSTLEKVRNVEILPPSTYNRRIPDELERIVLKALAKDVDDRYQNAIDLHDELQAFVYTAGEFYSRKELAGWMKKTFAREIDEESARLEAFRQLKPPAPEAPARAPTGSKPPPMPRKSAPSVPPAKAAAEEGVTRVDTVEPANKPSRKRPSQPAVDAKPGTGNADADKDLSWDDEELETQIYDTPEEEARAKRQRTASQAALAPKPASPIGPVAAPAHVAAPPVATPAHVAAPPVATPSGAASEGTGVSSPAPAASATSRPDLSSLTASGSAWTAPPATRPSTVPPPVPANPDLHETRPGRRPSAGPGPAAARAVPLPPPQDSMPALAAAVAVESRTSVRDYETPVFGAAVTAGQPRGVSVKWVVLSGVALVAVAAGVFFALGDGGDAGKTAKTVPAEPPPSTGSAAATTHTANVPAGGAATVAQSDDATGFDLYVSPGNIMSWKLDGESRTDRLPSRIRRIVPGEHTVTVDAPAGFVSESRKIVVTAGQAPKVSIELQPLELMGEFLSTPPGAEVTLIVDGKRQGLGAAPAHAAIDPRKSYQVLFEKPGFVAQNVPVAIPATGNPKVTVVLSKSATDTVAVARPSKPPTVDTPAKPGGGEPAVKPSDKPSDKPADKPSDKPAGPAGEGIIGLNSKPPCDVFVDGKATGQKTPVRELRLPAGPHRITLVNNEFSIREEFKVDVKPDKPQKILKDFSDKIPQ